MQYIRVKWNHSSSTDPVLLYSELDDARWEVRKVEVFADGHCGFASAIGSAGGTGLGKMPVPSLAEIATDVQFEPAEIHREEFECIWAMRRFLDGLNRRPGATDSGIAESEKQLGVKFPAEYVEFLKLNNGGEGFIGQNRYAMLWGVAELASMNQSYEVQKYAPGLLIFGSDGDGEAYGFDTRSPQWPIVQMPLIGMAWNVARPMGGSFSAFLERLHEAE